jgi:hypothetical protein
LPKIESYHPIEPPRSPPAVNLRRYPQRLKLSKLPSEKLP